MNTAENTASADTADTYEIVAVDVRDHRRIIRIKLDVTAHRHILLVAGNNGAGKTTLLDSLPAALGGAAQLAADPVRRGKSKAEIAVKLRAIGSGAEYTATRTIVAGKGTALKLVGPDGRIEPPQEWLDKMLAGRTLDPAGFLRKLAADQRATLLELLGLDTSAIDAEHDRAYTRRTEVGRELKTARAQLAGVPGPERVPEVARAVEVVQAELEQLDQVARATAAKRAERDRIDAGLIAVRDRSAAIRAEIERLQAELAQVDDRETREVLALRDADAALAALRPPAEVDAAIGKLRAEAARSSAYAVAVGKNAERRRSAEQLERLVEEREAEIERLTAIVNGSKAKRVELLKSRPMPVEGLGVDDTGLTLAGEDGPVPFDQASHAQRLRCALAIAMIQAGSLRDVWLRDGSLLDDEGLAAVRELAERYDRRVWLEVVGERHSTPHAIIIRAGALLEPEPVA